jgi:hypothetical protein
MNALEQYLRKLDESNYDCKDSHTINSEFQAVSTQLTEEGEHELLIISDLNRQVFSVQKSFDTKLDTEKGTIRGLSWQMSGTQTLEDGSQIPLYWPDVNKFTQQDYEYFEKRYKECKNLYAKTEYGLMVYFGEKTPFSLHNNFRKQLVQDLFQLSNYYFEKAKEGGKKNHYVLYFFKTLRFAFGIAVEAKLNPEISQLIQHMFEVHQNWDVTKEGTLRVLLDISGLMAEYYSIFNKQIDFQKVLDKNITGAIELEKTNIWGSMYAIDLNIGIEQKRNKPAKALIAYKAKLYEKLATDAEKDSNLACVSFSEKALRIYQQLDDTENIQRLEKYYTELRGKFHLAEIRQELPQEYTDNMNLQILRTIEGNNEIGIIQHFISTPWYDSIQNIRERSVELGQQSVLMSIIPTSIVDKFGNTVDTFVTDEEKEQYNFWNTYTFNYQLGTQTMHKLFLEAYKAGKLNYKSVSSYLETSWFNEEIHRNYHGNEVIVKPIDTLLPGLKRIFDELDNYFKAENYQYDYVTIIDSLTLKIEGLLRFFCEKIGIATFKPRQKGSEKLVMEKLLDELLADVAHKPPLKPDQITNFDEEDRMFIKYIMAEKAGVNLRNAVAHSLMDFSEYSFEHIVVLFCIIMKLSKYKFIEK